MQATSNGKLTQSGVAEKLGIFVQAVSASIAALVVAFITQWNLTLVSTEKLEVPVLQWMPIEVTRYLVVFAPTRQRVYYI